MISAIAAVNAINSVRDGEIVVATMTANRYWEPGSDNKDLDWISHRMKEMSMNVVLGNEQDILCVSTSSTARHHRIDCGIKISIISGSMSVKSGKIGIIFLHS